MRHVIQTLISIVSVAFISSCTMNSQVASDSSSTPSTTPTTSTRTPASLSVSSGNNQSGATSAALSSALVAVVKDAQNNVVSGVTVNWAVSSGGGSLTYSSRTTDSNGTCSNTFTLGSSAGTNTVTATVSSPSLSVTFTATAVAAPSLSYSGILYTFVTTKSAMSATATNSGGAITNCTVSPSLPTGLSLSTTTCAVTGTPTSTSSSTSYTITATNAGGSSSTSVDLEVLSVNSLDALFASETPATPNSTDGVPYELGVRFYPLVDGYVYSIKFYKAPSETGTHTGNLWDESGTLLATVTFSGESASGWQKQALTTPIALSRFRRYSVSVNTNGYFPVTPGLSTTTKAPSGSMTTFREPYYNTTPGSYPSSLSGSYSNYFVDLEYAPSVKTGYSLFSNVIPSSENSTDTSNYELGLKFQSSQNAYVKALRFYKARGGCETGVHTGKLWSQAGTSLATGTYTNETTAGWQEVTLSSPVAVTANTTYVVSVNTNGMCYPTTSASLTSAVTSGWLSSVAGNNGVFTTTPGSFPSSSFNDTNYFVDVLLTPNP